MMPRGPVHARVRLNRAVPAIGARPGDSLFLQGNRVFLCRELATAEEIEAVIATLEPEPAPAPVPDRAPAPGRPRLTVIRGGAR